MSDITKKIFSIESEGTLPSPKKSMSETIRPILAETEPPVKTAPPKPVPEFVTREAITPLSGPPQTAIEADTPGAGAGWIILGFASLYLIGVGFYFGQPLLDGAPELMSIAGLVLLLTLPLFLLFLLWRALKHLSTTSRQNARYAEAANILTSPDAEVGKRTATLASGIRDEITKVNDSLNETIKALNDVQMTVTRETQAIDAAGLQLSSRSEDVGRNLTLQRQALESISGTFDTRMDTLSSSISETGRTLDAICTEAEAKIKNASDSMQIASGKMDQTISDGSNLITQRITEIETISGKLGQASETLAAEIKNSAENLNETDAGLVEKTQAFETLNENARTHIYELQQTLEQGNSLLSELKTGSDERAAAIQTHYEKLRTHLKQSEDETLAVQGKTARMVESNLAQMRSEFTQMETDLRALQTKLNDLQTATPEAANPQTPEPIGAPRLNLTPLDSDFPPVEPPRNVYKRQTPLSLGVDMEIESVDKEIVDFDPNVIRRPGDVGGKVKSKGFGRRTDKNEGLGWRWRDMLGTLERPDAALPPAPAAASLSSETQSIDAVTILSSLQLSPAAIVDEGTVIDATQARINKGDAGLANTVSERLPDAVSHLRDKLAADPNLKAEIGQFDLKFAAMIGNTPPTAPTLRAVLGSPEGRAYLLCAAALKA